MTTTTHDPATLLALRLSVRHGALPPHWPDATLRSLRRRRLLDAHGRPTSRGLELARSPAAQLVHACTRCQTGAVVTDYATPRGDEECEPCHERLIADARKAARKDMASAAASWNLGPGEWSRDGGARSQRGVRGR